MAIKEASLRDTKTEPRGLAITFFFSGGAATAVTLPVSASIVKSNYASVLEMRLTGSFALTVMVKVPTKLAFSHFTLILGGSLTLSVVFVRVAIAGDTLPPPRSNKAYSSLFFLGYYTYEGSGRSLAGLPIS